MGTDEISEGRRVLEIESEAIRALIPRLGADFTAAVGLLWNCTGRVVITGLGKSGLVGRKIAATLASTGTPAIFVHPAEAVHGDIGMIGPSDVVMALSKSGETREVLDLLPIFKRIGLKMIAVTGEPDSTLGRAADVVLDSSVKEEACPLNLAPTASSTAALALGDALAITLLKKRGLTEEDLAFLHPGGAIGRKLLRVRDLMHTGTDVPLVDSKAPLEQVLLEMSSKRLGHTGVIGDGGELVGVITDGDLRRALEKSGTLAGKTASELMSASPKTINGDALAARALQTMEKHSITGLFVREENGSLEGFIHLHDILKARVA